MTEQEFQTRADAALQDLYQRLTQAAERHDFEADLNGGALIIEFEAPPAKFVVSPNSPVRQIWVSAHSKSFKLDWNPAREAFLTGDQTLAEMLSEAIAKQLGEPVSL